MAIELNCADDGAFPTATLGDLVTSVLRGLGFIDPLGPLEMRTLGDMRGEILDALGLATPLANKATRTLAQLSGDLLDLLGMAGQFGIAPPGVDAQLATFINDAEQALWRRLELDKGADPLPPRMVNGSDLCTLDYVPVLNLAAGMAKAHYQQPDAKAYFELAEKFVADEAQRNPPNVKAMVTRALQLAHNTVLRRFEMTPMPGTVDQFITDVDLTSTDPQPVLLLALANLKAKIGQGDAKGFMEQYERYMADALKRRPPGAREAVRDIVKRAQETLYRRYAVFRMERWFTWTLVQGQRFYGIGASAESSRLTAPTGVSVTPVLGSSQPYPLPGVCAYRVSAHRGSHYRDSESLASASAAAIISSGYFAHVEWDAVPGATGYNIYGRTLGGEKLLASSVSTTSWDDTGTIVPDGELPSNIAPSLRALDPRKATWVGVSSGDDSWRPLRKGIPPTLYGTPYDAPPTHFEIRQCIEVWPSPAPGWLLRIKGHFAPFPMVADQDTTTIDAQAVELFALAEAKAHFRQPDARDVMITLERYIGDLVAGSHSAGRYLPGIDEPRNAVRPVLV